MPQKYKILIFLIVLGVVDIFIPIPITALWLIYILFQKPDWFKHYVDGIYTP